MRFSTAAATLLSVAGFAAAQQTHIIKVGDGGLAFNPSSLTAPVGDTVQFQFVAKNHSVTQSTFDNPCVFKDQGVDSGFLKVDANATEIPSWSFQIDSTDALWFFCAQIVNGTSHCQNGMVFALNPTAEKSFDTYKAKAMNNAAEGGAAGASGSAAASGAAPTASESAAGGAGASGASGAASATDSAGAGASPTAGADTTGGVANNQNAGSNGALGMSGNVISMLSISGLVLGLML